MAESAPGAEAEPVSGPEESIPIDGPDADSARVMERALETLARTAPTPEDIAEQEERRHRNRVAEIMRPAPTGKRLVFKRNEDALVQSDRAASMAAIRAKAGRGERLARHERIAVWADAIDAGITSALKSGRVEAAVVELARECAAHSVAHRELIDRLEDRIAALEAAAAKPRAKTRRG